MSDWRGTSVGYVAPTERVLETDGSVQPLSDADDSVRTLHDDPKQLHIDEVNAAMVEIMQRDTGDTAPVEKRLDAESRHDKLREQSIEIADRLESVGRSAYRQSEFTIYTYHVHSGKVETEPNFRRKMFIPDVARKLRQPMVNAAEFWLQRNPFDRMWVLSSGGRCKLTDVRTHQTAHQRKVSRLNSEILRPLGLQIVLACTEHGTPEYDQDGERQDAGEIERDQHGHPTFHVHTHAIVHHIGGKPLSEAKWEAALKAVWSFWHDWWGDAGQLHAARETVKYITKPGEMLKLTAQELAELDDQLARSKRVRPMGALREEIRARRERCMKLDRCPTPDGRVWRETFDWDRWGSPAMAKKPAAWHAQLADTALAIENADRRRRGLPEFEIPARLRDRARWTSEASAAATERVLAHPGDRTAEREPTPLFVARLVPGFARGSLIREPRIRVVASRFDESITRHPWAVHLRDITRDFWDAGQAAAAGIRVHTCTPTVRADRPEVESLATGPPAVGPPFVPV